MKRGTSVGRNISDDDSSLLRSFWAIPAGVPFVLVGIISAYAQWRAIIGWATLCLELDAQTSLFLVAQALSAGILFHCCPWSTPVTLSRCAVVVFVAVLVHCCAVLCWGSLTAWAGIFLCWGTVFGSIAFLFAPSYVYVWICPLMVLLFGVPLPSCVLKSLVEFLGSVSVHCATLAANGVISIDVLLIGGHITCNGATVASMTEECSGIISFRNTLVIASFFAFCRTRLLISRIIVIGVAPIMAVCGNITRIALAITLRAFGYSELADGIWHAASGHVILIIEMGFLWILASHIEINEHYHPKSATPE